MADDTASNLEALRAAWAQRYAPQLHLDPASELDRLLVTHLDGPLAALEPYLLNPPLAASTRRNYERHIANFERWCVHGDLADDTRAVAQLPTAVLRVAVEQWLAWRVSDITPDHPLADRGWGGRRSKGLRDVEALQSAVKWWSLAHGLGDLLSNRARMITGRPEPVRPARAPSDDELVAIIEALVGNEVVTALTPTITAAWHARQLAAVNIALAGSLRPNSEFVLLRDENVVVADGDALAVRLPRTKAQPAGRLVHLHRRDDALCPVWSLARFLKMCDDAGWNRGGFLLPTVYRRRYQPLGKPSVGAALTNSFRLITDHLGITDDLDSGLRATPHGLRAVTPTKAFAAGMDVYTVMALTGHVTVEGARGYDRSGSASDEFLLAMADDLASGSSA